MAVDLLFRGVRPIYTRRDRNFNLNGNLLTLGARDFSSAVSGFCQVFIVIPREKPLEQSAIALMAPIQSLTRLNQLVQILDKTADWLLTTT